MEDYLKDLQKRIREHIETEKRIQKQCEGPGHENLVVMSLGKMMAYDNCIKEVDRLIAHIRNVKDNNTSYF
jgi:hypothetical protein